jgi:predicted alpha/beta-hydrolase family hydrolase
MSQRTNPGIEGKKLTIRINERESVTALLYPAAKRKRAGTTVLLGHGAGANQMSDFMRIFASGLAARGFDAMTFNFIYTEQGRRLPDPKARLESCFRAAIQAARTQRKTKANRLVISGKSMGGRIASQVAAADELALPHRPTPAGLPVCHPNGAAPLGTPGRGPRGRASDTRAPVELAALVFLGYPLHPPGKPEQLRAGHLKDIRTPMLFVQGSRDVFGTPEEIRAVMKKFRLPATLYVVEDGDHSFKVPKKAGLRQQQVYETVMDEIAGWLRSP